MAQRQGRAPAPRRRDPNSLTASAVVLTAGMNSAVKLTTEQWQQQAWEMYDAVGELRFGVNWVANALSRVNLVAAIPPKSQGDEPVPIDIEKVPGLSDVVNLVAEIAGGVAGQGQLLAAVARQITVPGVGYIIAHANTETDAFEVWRCYSNEEVKRQPGDGTILALDPETGAWKPVGEQDIVIKVWRSHPRKASEPDSPVRAVLGVLREIVRLSQRIEVAAASRLAANGITFIPMEVEFPAGQGITRPTGDSSVNTSDDATQFVQTLMDVASAAIADPSHPAARVPLFLQVPGEYVDKINHVDFATKLDQYADTQRTSAVKRLALGLDMPPEVLMGLGDTNHWSAWQISEEAITLQIEPLAELVCHALTEGWLKPALKGLGMKGDEAVVWYDTTDLTTRPDRSGVAAEAHKELLLSDAAYLRELGLDVADMPSEDELRRRLLVKVALGAPAQAAAMLAAAGILPQVVADAAAEAAPGASSDTPPADQPADAPPPAERALPDQSADASLVAALGDTLVLRALEVAGRRLRGAVGRGKPGGDAAVTCDDPTRLHTLIAADEHLPFDALLAGAWQPAERAASLIGLDPDAFTTALDAYTRTLLATRRPHEVAALSLSLRPLIDGMRPLETV